MSNSVKVEDEDGTRRWFHLKRRMIIQAAVLAATIFVLEIAVFGGYFLGERIPPWDFLGSYNTTAFLWWKEGSFFKPIEWIPSSLAGYPSALFLQSSAWYLPVGIASLFGPFTLHAAAVVSALHVAFGSAGTYALLRSLRMPFTVAVFAAVAAFFAVGYYSNAQHVDIVRAYAWVPWILFVLSPRWPWQRIWSIPVAAIMLWQAVTGMYPGMVFATAYVGIVWLAAYQWQERPSLRKFLAPLSVAAVAAAFLSAPRLLPYFLMSGETAVELDDTSEFSFTMLGTLLFGYGSRDGFPNNISMNSFFLPATVLALCWFADFRSRIAKLALAVGVPALLLGMPFFPWFDVTQKWPGLGLSRFTMSDFKVFILLSILLLASSGLHQLISRRASNSQVPWLRLAGALVLGAVLFVAGNTGPYRLLDWLPSFALFVVTLILLPFFGLPWFRRRTYAISVALIALTVASGALWAFTTRLPWYVPRITAEIENYGATVDQLLALRDVEPVEVQRPARMPLPPGYDSKTIFSGVWNASYYSGKDAVGGYVNIKGSETVELLTAALSDQERGPSLAEFLAAPGLVLSSDSTPTGLRDCAKLEACGDVRASPIRYRPGYLEYQISARQPSLAVLNEAYYPGWDARACEGGDCRPVVASRSNDGLVQVSLPKGEYNLHLEYGAPGRTSGWALFASGIFVMAASPLAFRHPWRRGYSVHAQSDLTK